MASFQDNSEHLGSAPLTEISLGHEVEAFITRMIELTGYSVEELILQVIVTNYPELTSSLVELLQSSILLQRRLHPSLPQPQFAQQRQHRSRQRSSVWAQRQSGWFGGSSIPCHLSLSQQLFSWPKVVVPIARSAHQLYDRQRSTYDGYGDAVKRVTYNNSFKPNPLRCLVQLARWSIATTHRLARCGSA